jgi:hypothetical protein
MAECLKTIRGHNAHVYAVFVGRRGRQKCQFKIVGEIKEYFPRPIYSKQYFIFFILPVIT